MSHLMDYGPDWPPAPNADSRASDDAHRIAYWAASRRRFVFWFRIGLIAALLCLASVAIVDSRIEPNRGEPTIMWTDPSPNPAPVYGHP